MKLAVSILIAFVGIASASKVPTFSWLEDQFSPSGVPLLSINFHDGKPNDVAVLKQFNPIPRQAHEREEDIDKCIFNGHLRDEPKVHVTLTGGCPFEKNFDIMFLSQRSSEFKFQVRDLATNAIPSISQTRGLIFDRAIKPPASIAKPFKNPEVAPENGFTLRVQMNIDQAFANHFGGDAGNVIRRVTAHATNIWTWPSLASPLTWAVTDYYAIPDSGVEASNEWLNYVANYNNPQVNSNVYVGYQNDQAGVVGLAWVGTICGPTSYRTAVCEYFNNDMTSGEIMAHEVGHNAGMDHDFNGSPGNPRYDSQGQSCTNIGGVMDYYQTVTQWSSCSNEDFNSRDHSCL